MFRKDNSREIEIIQANLTTFVEATKVNVVTLSDAISDLSQSANANAKGNEQIAGSATGVAQKTAEQLELVKDNLNLIEDRKSTRLNSSHIL